MCKCRQQRSSQVASKQGGQSGSRSGSASCGCRECAKPHTAQKFVEFQELVKCSAGIVEEVIRSLCGQSLRYER
jgi:hypothetical protein